MFGRERIRNQTYLREDKPVEHCGVAGAISFNKTPVLKDILEIQNCLQHRGQDGVGMVSLGEDNKFHVRKKTGLVSDAFSSVNPTRLKRQLRGDLAIGHNRYETSGTEGSKEKGIQPFIIRHEGRRLAIAHNGNIPEDVIQKVKEGLPTDLPYTTDIDSEVIGWSVMMAPGDSWKEKIKHALKDLHGAYSLVFATDNHELIAARDPLSIKPLAIAYGKDGVYVASENVGFEFLNGKLDGWENVKGGEIVVVKKTGEIEKEFFAKSERSAHCVLEDIYFSHPISKENGFENTEIRNRMGQNLAREEKVKFSEDVVVCGVPESGIAIAEGYGQELGIYVDRSLIHRDRYRSRKRGFIERTQQIREEVNRKKWFISERVRGQEIIIVDDSLIRSTTIKILIEKLREKGASKINVRIASPRLVDNCDLGIDIAHQDELIALDKQEDFYRQKTDEEIASAIGADSVRYLSVDDLVDATGREKNGLCMHCFTKEHPIFDSKDVDKDN